MSNTPDSPTGVPYATAPQLYAATTVLPVLCMALFVPRLHHRTATDAGIGIDDWLLVVALLLIDGCAVALIIGIQGGAIAYPTIRDPNETPQQQVTEVNPITALNQKVAISVLLMSTVALGCIKLSLILFYQRLFVHSRRSYFNYSCWAIGVISVMWTLAFFFKTLFLCGTDIAANWGSLLEVETHCVTMAAAGLYAYPISDLITNCIIWILPIPMIWRLQMPKDRKLLVIGLLGLASISIIATIMKLLAILEMSGIISNNGKPVDVDLAGSTMLYWIMIEMGLAVIAICLPSTQHYVPKMSISSLITSLRGKVTSGPSSKTKSSQSWTNGESKPRSSTDSQPAPTQIPRKMSPQALEREVGSKDSPNPSARANKATKS